MAAVFVTAWAGAALAGEPQQGTSAVGVEASTLAWLPPERVSRDYRFAVAPAQQDVPLSYEERGTYAKSESWINRVQMATTAAAVYAASSDPQAPGFAQGLALARYYLQQQEVLAQRVAWLVLVSDEVKPDEISDADLTALIVSKWPAYAAVLAP